MSTGIEMSLDSIANLVKHWEFLQRQHALAMLGAVGSVPLPPPPPSPTLLLQTAIEYGERVDEGVIIRAVAIPWFNLLEEMERDPKFFEKLTWRQSERLVAAQYEQAGFDVILTPPSNDGGRDVIATLPGVIKIRIIDQVKSYRPGHVVTAEDVRALVGVLTAHPNVSKGVVTTTSTFAPGIMNDANLTQFMPTRLELRDGQQLRKELLDGLASGSD